MDNVCHTLVGAAFAEAGLKRQTRFGTPVLLIAANLPDLDVLAYAASIPAVAIRRGWTHGVLAQVLLPALLTGLVVLLARVRRPPPDAPPVRAAGLLALSYAGVLSHVSLDWLNTYGIRLLMPFSPQWFYGDAVFIVDPWLWLMLGLGVYLARRRRSHGPARIAIAAATLYIAAAVASARAARAIVLDAWMKERGAAPYALMVGPVPLNTFRKTIIVDAGEHYERGTFEWWPLRVAFDGRRVPKGSAEPAVVRARLDPHVRAVLVWARFPYFEIARADGGTRVLLGDMRFGRRVGSASVLVPD